MKSSVFGVTLAAFAALVTFAACSSTTPSAPVDAGTDASNPPPSPDGAPPVGDASLGTDAPVGDAASDGSVRDAAGDGATADAGDADDASGPCPAGMVLMPAGTYMMGANDAEAEPTEQPPVPRTLAAYCIDVTEVTSSAYAACVTAGVCAPALTGGYCNSGAAGRGNHPINCLDYNQALAYCGWLGKRIPSEEEWEYAARETSGRTYPWGTTPLPSAQLCWSGVVDRDVPGGGPDTGTCAVAQFVGGDTPRGVKDMAGNVWEWTSSGHSQNHASPRDNTLRVIRGGGWDFKLQQFVRTTYRQAFVLSYADVDIGVRCAK